MIAIKRSVTRAVLCFAALGFAIPASAETCAPKQLVHIVAVNVTPGVVLGSFSALPKSLYRVGATKLRLEEAPDPINAIHELIVVSEPNIWTANLYDRTGKHIVDPGPTFFAKAPVFDLRRISAKLLAFEFGCEADFIAMNAPAPVRLEKIGDTRFEVYRVDDGADAVEILRRPGTSAPAFARYYHDGSVRSVLRYNVYQTGLANNPELFAPPSGVRYIDAMPMRRTH